MSDEQRGDWFTPDLRDVRSAFVAEVLAWAVIAAVLVLAFPPLYAPSTDWAEWAVLVVFAVGLFLGPIVVFLAVKSSRYRALGLAPPFSAAFLLLAASQYLEVLYISSYAMLVFAALVALSVGQFTRQSRAESGRPTLKLRRIVHGYWWSRTAAMSAQALGLVAIFFARKQFGTEPFHLSLTLLLCLAAILCVWCWLRFLRPFVELCLEPIARMLYRIRSKGEKQLPAFGPCLVVANHAFWFDPCVLGVVLPRPITPIMTERFFKVWFIKPLLRYVFRVIVVPETPMKRETPELEQAMAALDRGEVVVIFPEGYLRRKEEVPLRRFGQGVWRILAARPDTPVVACWVEGGWGSKFSYKNGPPTKNKKMDFRRKIDIGVSAAESVPSEVLADQMATRLHLMNRVAAMRAVVGLTPLPAFERVNAGEERDGSAESI